MENYIHKANLALFKKRLGERHTDAQHDTLLKLLADEEAKDPPPKKRDSEALTETHRTQPPNSIGEVLHALCYEHKTDMPGGF